MSNSGKEQMAADRRGPKQAVTGQETPQKICIAGSGASQNVDLSSASAPACFGSIQYMDRYVTISVEGGASFWWYWSSSGADTIDKTATGNGATVGAFCPSGILQDELPMGQFLVIQTSAAANIHIWLSSGTF